MRKFLSNVIYAYFSSLCYNKTILNNYSLTQSLTNFDIVILDQIQDTRNVVRRNIKKRAKIQQTFDDLVSNSNSKR